MSGWISVRDRLPEDRQSVLLLLGTAMVVGFWEYDDWERDGVAWKVNTGEEWYTSCDEIPSFWMPLPPPPGEENTTPPEDPDGYLRRGDLKNQPDRALKGGTDRVTKELLERYPALCLELTLLNRRGALPAQRRELEGQKEDIESFVKGIADPTGRTVVFLRALQGLTWQQVAAQMEGRYSREYVRKIYRRTLKKYF